MTHAAEQSLAADGARACFSSNLFQPKVDADSSPQLKAVVRRLFWLESRIMNRKAIYISMIVVCILLVSIWYLPRHIWTSVYHDGAGGGDSSGFGPRGKGNGFSIMRWKSMNGVIVEEMVVGYSSSEEASKDFEEELNAGGTVVEHSSENRRIVKVFGNPQARDGAAKIISLSGRQIRFVSAGSLTNALTFERSWLKL